MKKNTFIYVIAVPAIIACTIFMKGSLIYLATSLMIVVIIGLMRGNKSRVTRITRWAKANPRKAQALITVMQFALMALGIFAGNNLKELGYNFSDTTAYVFSTVIVIGFLSAPFLPKRNLVALPKTVNRHRVAFMSIALSTFVLMAIFGSRLKSDYPKSGLTFIVSAIDKAIFYSNDDAATGDEVYTGPSDQSVDPTMTSEPSNMVIFAAYSIHNDNAIAPTTLSKKEIREKLNAEKKVKRFERKSRKMMHQVMKKRVGMMAPLGAVAILLIVLLGITTCAGLCLAIAGFSSGSTIGYGFLGLVVGAASIFGIIKVSQGGKTKPKTEP